MVQIKCLSNGLYSLKNSHIPFGKGFHPPTPYDRIPSEYPLWSLIMGQELVTVLFSFGQRRRQLKLILTWK